MVAGPRFEPANDGSSNRRLYVLVTSRLSKACCQELCGTAGDDVAPPKRGFGILRLPSRCHRGYAPYSIGYTALVSLPLRHRYGRRGYDPLSFESRQALVSPCAYRTVQPAGGLGFRRDVKHPWVFAGVRALQRPVRATPPEGVRERCRCATRITESTDSPDAISSRLGVTLSP